MDKSVQSQDSVSGSKKGKGLLVRSNALCGDDDTKSLRPPPPQATHSEDASKQQGTSLATAATKSMPTHLGPGGSNFKSADSDVGRLRTKHHSNASSVSHASDYTDSTGVDLLQFINNTLHKNAKDREMLLNLETEMRKFIQDTSKQAYKFPKMSSYNRMLVHRVAAFFGLDHNIDQSGTVVVVNKTPSTRIPEMEFRRLIRNNTFTDRMLNRRNVQSFDECRMASLYGNFNPALVPGLASPGFPLTGNYGSATFVDPYAAGDTSSSTDMVRRARSFEVGEWQNSMATSMGGLGLAADAVAGLGGSLELRHHRLSGGGSSANSAGSSSWQLHPGQAATSPILQQLDNISVGSQGSQLQVSAGFPLAGIVSPTGPALYHQSSFPQSSRQEVVQSRFCRMGSGEGAQILAESPSYGSYVRTRQLSSVSNPASVPPSLIPNIGYPQYSVAIQQQCGPTVTNTSIEKSQDSGFEGGGGSLVKGPSMEGESQIRSDSESLDAASQQLFGTPTVWNSPYTQSPPQPYAQQWSPGTPYSPYAAQYGKYSQQPLYPQYMYGPNQPGSYAPYSPAQVMYTPTQGQQGYAMSQPQYYVSSPPPADYMQEVSAPTQPTIQMLVDQYQQSMQIFDGVGQNQPQQPTPDAATTSSTFQETKMAQNVTDGPDNSVPSQSLQQNATNQVAWSANNYPAMQQPLPKSDVAQHKAEQSK
ncbi:r3H domain-containing protein [Ditylenchus destructor]|uniref:R3H domain-containing protein n=1 Tax=Ditylenchus destructor TaxID=166010 RepID=A0AAD4N686_9BILA|nr:r3H domain-containing protein [Ditylenchus destructor]